MAVSTIAMNNSFQHFINASDISTSANTFMDTGLSFTIPAKSMYLISGTCIYGSSKPSGACLMLSTYDPSVTHARLAYTDAGRSACYFGVTGLSSITISFWGRWAGSANNHAELALFYCRY